ncbi:MAG: lyase family protein [Bacteroidales bacterium]|jgi:aspartate ammonia-lyase|nr:lyase family protein [Bacteroidales bacterium]
MKNDIAMRREKDFIGEKELDENALYGIHSVRARENFPDEGRFSEEWYRAMAVTKRACYLATASFFAEAAQQYDLKSLNIRVVTAEKLDALSAAADECTAGKHFEHFIVPAISGGAGTSINMNMNEIITNRALQILGRNPGEYDLIDPIEDANIFQSTNDVVPTALRVAAMNLLLELEESINELRKRAEELEERYRSVLRIGYTQMQEAVPTTYGRLFSSYSDALSRDWWRVSKCLERIKVVNLGGSAVGTSITVPRFFVAEVVTRLQQLTGLPVTRGENLSDATSNLDPLVEVHGIIKTHAVTMEKMAGDLRMLASDIHDRRTLSIPARQAGSSVMPGKVNPVIPEFVISCSHRVYSNDQLVSSLSAQGCLELNAYLPLIGHTLLESIKTLIAADHSMAENMLSGLEIEAGEAEKQVMSSPAVTTALLPFIGYKKATAMAGMMKEERLTIFEANEKLGYVNPDKLTEILKPENLVQGGYRLKDIEE